MQIWTGITHGSVTDEGIMYWVKDPHRAQHGGTTRPELLLSPHRIRIRVRVTVRVPRHQPDYRFGFHMVLIS